MNKLSLFSGVGGIDLAAEWAGMNTVAFCEREPFPQKVLRKHWPNTPIYDDVCTLSREVLERDGIITNDRAIDIISAGYPCQPESLAGERKGTADDRWLWPEVRRLINEIRPHWFIGENVFGHVSMGLDIVLSDLEADNYTTEAIIIPACSSGAPHRRDRVFIVGHTERSGCSGESWWRTEQEFTDGHIGVEKNNVANADSPGQQKLNSTAFANRTGHRSWGAIKRGAKRTTEPGLGGVLNGLSSWLDGYRWPAARGQPQHDWEPPRVATGVKDRVGRLKALGNAVNPVQVYPILASIKAIDDMGKAQGERTI